MRIGKLNDAFRRNPFNGGGKFFLTQSVVNLPQEISARAVTMMTEFSDFNEDNDPSAERDFGSFDLEGFTFFWKIDYYDKKMECGSEDPADPTKTMRVLTLMLAQDY
jgi:hypothetical protein